jgi:hypothetical protein
MGEYRYHYLASFFWEGDGGGGGGDLTRVEGVDRVNGGGRAAPPTLSKLGRKYHHDSMYTRKWTSRQSI